MQILIDIPIDDFNEVLKGVICDEIFDDLIDAFRGGIVLPEKHGRLKDIDHYLKMHWEHPDYSISDDEPTIIEATEN